MVKALASKNLKKFKIIHFLRHGQATHNVKAEEVRENGGTM